MGLRDRLEAALYAADLFGIAEAPTPQRIAHLVLFELAKLADEWDDEGRDFYYAHRHRGPIEFADGFECGLAYAADLLRGADVEAPAPRDWSS